MAEFLCTGVIHISNILLDKLPQDYEGYLIRTDFGVGIQISLCAADIEIPSQYEKTAIMMNLLFGRGMPDFETAMSGLNWYLSCGKGSVTGGNQTDSVQDEPEIMSFEFDDTRIYSAFRKVYGIDLQTQRLHWFQFISYLQDLSGTAYSDVIQLRQTKESEVDVKKRAEFLRMKKRFQIPCAYSEEEQAEIDGFLKEINQN